jgi:hypothetical protein
LPHALRGASLNIRMGVQRSVRVEALPYDDHRDSDTGMLVPLMRARAVRVRNTIVAGSSLFEAVEVLPGTHHRLLDCIFRVDGRTQHAIAVTGKDRTVYFQLRDIDRHPDSVSPPFEMVNA